ncbi:MAG: 4Fe-4S dicluster domain-containing protein [Deltaproteobacteria bacterium]|nr:MAG: 4Fe-4S dicluster domain-containing protein [Deltaproteobacteria bacterium]
MNRRGFFKLCGAAAGSTALAARAGGRALASAPRSETDPYGILIDTTRCVGCNTCSEACAEAHELPEPNTDEDVLKDTTVEQWTVINKFDVEDEEIYVKRQCMHCLEPACVSACLTEAMHKTEDGAVVWEADKCMGCRLCMLSCPFDIPKYEWNSPNPRVQKCVRCFERTEDGKVPACVDACPEEAIVFGRRSQLLAEAHKRMAENPDDYTDHIYGENEAGGTAMLYLAAVPFEELGFKTNLGTRAFPEYTKEFLYAVPFVLAGVPALLLGINRATHHRDDDDDVTPHEEG